LIIYILDASKFMDKLREVVLVGYSQRIISILVRQSGKSARRMGCSMCPYYVNFSLSGCRSEKRKSGATRYINLRT